MGKVSLRRIVCWTSCTLAVLLQGCAVVTSPGFDFADPQVRGSVTLGQYVPADADRPPQGVITPITPALVHALVASEPRGPSPAVASLFAQPTPYTIGPSDIISVVVYDHPELQPVPGGTVLQVNDPTGITGAPAQTESVALVCRRVWNGWQWVRSCYRTGPRYYGPRPYWGPRRHYYRRW